MLNLTRKQVAEIVEDMELDYEDGTHSAALVLMASMVVGTNANACFTFLSGLVKRAEVRRISQRLRKYGIWKDQQVNATHWFDKDIGDVAFTLDLMVGAGIASKHPPDDNPSYALA